MPDTPATSTCDLAIVGAGAAGLMAAIWAARRRPDWTVCALDGATKLGAKILVAGGGRCNVTNRTVTPADFCGRSPHIIKRVLAAFTVPQTIAFFAELGVTLHEEEHGKLFPDTNHARTVLDALLTEARERNVQLRTGHRVTAIRLATPPDDDTLHATGRPCPTDAAPTDDSTPPAATAFMLDTSHGLIRATRVLLATGGLSLPKTGSDGAGYDLARSLGHSIVPTTPALDPLLLAGDFHAALSGVSHPAELTVHTSGHKPVRLSGALLWTHFGLSGPVTLNASRHWHRARAAGLDTRVSLSFLPGDDFASAEQRLLALATAEPRLALRSALARWLPARVADALLSAAPAVGHPAPSAASAHAHAASATRRDLAHIPLAQLPRDDRRRLIRALTEWPLPVTAGRGYKYAEVTAGGVPLAEVDPATLQSRCSPGLYLAGEILDVDGRIGGYNFQWAWSSGYLAAAGAGGPGTWPGRM